MRTVDLAALLVSTTKGLQICSKILPAGPAVKLGKRDGIGHGAAAVAQVRLFVETGRR